MKWSNPIGYRDVGSYEHAQRTRFARRRMDTAFGTTKKQRSPGPARSAVARRQPRK